MAPIVRRAEDGERELVMARWGMPGPPQFGGQPVTNIRNLSSPHWRGWLAPKYRCTVPATSFCECEDTKPRKTPIWFALAEDRPRSSASPVCGRLARLKGPKSAPVVGQHELFGFLTMEVNAIVAPIHPMAIAGREKGRSRPTARARPGPGVRPGGHPPTWLHAPGPGEERSRRCGSMFREHVHPGEGVNSPAWP